MNNSLRLSLILLGPVLFLCSYYFIPIDLFGSLSANGAIGTVIWMALWWITSPVDLAVTALLPIVVNAVFSLCNMKTLIANYSSETILLLLGASILTVAWEETKLDKRIAARILSLVGSNLRSQILCWFLFACALSSILPNAVVCATLVPIAVAMLKYTGISIENNKKGSLIVLTIVYAAGVGGLATPLGGAMNLVTVKYIEQLTGKEYIYSEWIMTFLPVMIILIVSNIIFLMFSCKKNELIGNSKEYFIAQYKALPKISFAETVSLCLFIIATILSFTRQLYQAYLPEMKPAYVFITVSVFTFLISFKGGNRLLTWKNTQGKIVWELMFVFAGGLALGDLINSTGAAKSIGQIVANSNLTGGLLSIIVVLSFTIILSDITSNTATAAVAIPIVIAIFQGIGRDPIPYVYVASIGVNISYMLPTSIRAIPVGYGLKPSFMLKTGIPMTVMVLVLASLLSYFVLI